MLYTIKLSAVLFSCSVLKFALKLNWRIRALEECTEVWPNQIFGFKPKNLYHKMHRDYSGPNPARFDFLKIQSVPLHLLYFVFLCAQNLITLTFLGKKGGHLVSYRSWSNPARLKKPFGIWSTVFLTLEIFNQLIWALVM